MGRLCINQAKSPRFLIYCGGGVYVKAVSLANNQSSVETGPIDRAMTVPRGVAIGALHAARRAGLRAWLIQHQGGSFGVSGVAA